MNLAGPPEGLSVSFDMHGVRCEVHPIRKRPLWTQAALAGLAGGATLLGVAASVGLVAASIGVHPLFALGFLGVMLWWLVVFLAVAADRAEQLERLDVRIGEGMLVVRHEMRGSLIQDEDEVVPGTRPLTEVERLDLRHCTHCRVARGPILQIHREDGEVFVIAMRGHSIDEIGWLAGAVDLGIRDARQSDVVPPEALQLLRGV